MKKSIACVIVLVCANACATKFKSASGMTNAGASNGVPGAGGSGSAAPGAAGSGGTGAAAGMGMGPGAAGSQSSGAGGASAGAGAGTGGSSAGMASSDGGTPQLGDASLQGTGGSAETSMPVTCPATSTLQPGDSNGTIDVGGLTRDYIVHVPPSYTGQTPVPLVTDWHGILFTNTVQQSFSGYQQKADKEGFIVVFPNGIDTAWNVGWCCTSDKSVDDVAFARALVAKLQAQACIDPKRVYAVGYSMGGGMSMKLACDAADLIAAIAPAAFDLMTEQEWPCQPSRPITIIAFRSTADPIVPYTGGPTSPPNGLPITVDFLGAEANFMKWAALDGCTGSPSAADANGCRTYSQCQQGAEVTLCTTQGGSHDYGDPDIAWEMLKKHPLP